MWNTRIAESSTGSTSQPKIIGSTPKTSSPRAVDAQMLGMTVLQTEKKFLIYSSYIEGIGKAIERSSYIDAVASIYDSLSYLSTFMISLFNTLTCFTSIIKNNEKYDRGKIELRK